MIKLFNFIKSLKNLIYFIKLENKKNEFIFFSESKEYIGWEDYALWLDIAKAGFKFKF